MAAFGSLAQVEGKIFFFRILTGLAPHTDLTWVRLFFVDGFFAYS